jgi:hypothetical protein
MSAHLLLPSPFHSEKCSCVQDFSRGSEKLLGYSKAIDWHEMNERPLLGQGGPRSDSRPAPHNDHSQLRIQPVAATHALNLAAGVS